MTDRSDPTRAVSPGLGHVREAVQRWRLALDRDAPGGDRQGDQPAWEAALAGSGLPVAGLDLPVPKPRFAIAAQLPAGAAGEAELVDVWLTERMPRWRVREALEPRLPAGHRLVDVYDAWLGEPPLPGLVIASVYRVRLGPAGPSPAALRAAAATMLAADTLPRRRPKGVTTVAYDLRPFLEALEIGVGTGEPDLRMTLRHDPEKGMGRPDEVLAELGDRAGGSIPVEALIRERVVLREHSTEPPTRSGSAGRARR